MAAIITALLIAANYMLLHYACDTASQYYKRLKKQSFLKALQPEPVCAANRARRQIGTGR